MSFSLLFIQFVYNQALKLLHHSPEFLPFVIFLSCPSSSSKAATTISSTRNHKDFKQGQMNGGPCAITSVSIRVS